MTYRFGDIYLVRFHPATGRKLKKYRPAVIVSEVTQQVDQRFVMIAPLTSLVADCNSTELLIAHSQLKYPSKILTWYLKTTDASRLAEKIGELSTVDKKKLRKQLKQLF